MNWSQLHWLYPPGDAPALFTSPISGPRERAWRKVEDELCLQEGVEPQSFAGVPLLWVMATGGCPVDRDAALSVAGRLVWEGGLDEENVRARGAHADLITELAVLADRHLGDHARDARYMSALREMLALEGHLAWVWALDDPTDAFLGADCPRCGVEVTIAVGEHGDYSAIRHWHRGDIDRRPLRPAERAGMSPLGLRLTDIAIRDGRTALSRSLPYMFGQAECPCCGEAFAIAPAFEIRVRARSGPQLPGT